MMLSLARSGAKWRYSQPIWDANRSRAASEDAEKPAIAVFERQKRKNPKRQQNNALPVKSQMQNPISRAAMMLARADIQAAIWQAAPE